jgi:glucose-6-phosphate isomerase
VINIGIGGSDLGPVMAYEALKHYSDRDMTFRFVSNVDGTDFAEAVRDLDPAETLFIVSSKTFTTLETMTNAHSRARLVAGGLGGDEASVAKHFVAVSTNARRRWRSSASTPPTCSSSGIGSADATRWTRPSACRPCWPSVRRISRHAGRLPPDGRAFPHAPFERNLPVLMGLLTVWYNDFFGAQTVAVLPYEQYLKRFPAYLQQLTMESNGKHVTLDGTQVTTTDRPIYWGEPGTNGQHSFYQLIHQGTRLIPCDFIAFRKAAQPAGPAPRHADGERVRPGRGAGVRQDGRASQGRGHAGLAGAAPGLRGQPAVEHDPAERLTPEALGKLVALYEHSVFTQGAIWNIDSFDQWGVELGKVLAQRIIPDMTRHDAEQRSGDGRQGADNAFRVPGLGPRIVMAAQHDPVDVVRYVVVHFEIARRRSREPAPAS